MRRTYSLDEARAIAEALDIDFAQSGFDLEQFQSGLDVEAEHGAVEPATDVTGDDPLTTGKIALAHLRELPDYYSRLQKMECDAEGAGKPTAGRVRILIAGLAVGLTLGVAAIVGRRFAAGRRRG